MPENKTDVLSQAEAAFASRLTDLTYGVSEEVFGALEHVGYVPLKNNGKRLWEFLEVVAFVLFWIERSGQKRVFGTRVQAWDRAFSKTKNDWGAFFSEYPEGPIIDDQTRQDIAGILNQKCVEYSKLYRSKLENRGALHAHNTCCERLLEKILRLSGPLGKHVSEETNDAVCHHLGRAVQDLARQMDALMLTNSI